jgi:alpha-N-arabinofuranosidase
MTIRSLVLTLTLACSATLLYAAQASSAAPQARIKIDTDRVIGEVDPLLFGNFTEQLGRCIYGGIFEEGSPLSDSDGFRKDVMEAVKGLGVSILRWPGGNFVSGYNWKDGVGPRDLRPPRPDHAWGALETNRFGTDEFLNFCQRIGTQPYLCINAGLGSVDDARGWVEYTNEMRDTYWARQRRKNGHDQPWDVKYWGLGNEIDGPWQLGHKNAEDYAKFALEAAKAMHRQDDSIKLIASGSSNFGADWIGWNRTVLEALKREITYLSLHTYIGNEANDIERFLAVSRDLDDRIDVVDGQIRAALVTMKDPHPIYIAFDEWNVWYRTLPPPHPGGGNREFEIGHTGLEEPYNFEDALAMGVFFNAFIRHANVVKMANLAQLVNVIAPIFTNKQGLYLQTIYFPLVEYGNQRSNLSVNTLVKSPEYQPNGGGRPTGYLDVSTTYDAKSHLIYLNVLNRSADKAITTSIENVEGKVSPQAELWQMDNPDLKAVNTFGNDHKVRPTTKGVTLQLAHNTFSYAFPKHSLTILKLKAD